MVFDAIRGAWRADLSASWNIVSVYDQTKSTRKMVKLSSADLGRADDEVAQKRVRQYPKDG